VKIQAPILATSAPPRKAEPQPAASPAPQEPVDTPPEPQQPTTTTREQRVVRFLKGLTTSSLEHLRYLSSIYAWNMAGTTLGAIGFTPVGIHFAHENPAVVGGVAIGGAVATGGLAAIAGYMIEKKKGDAHLEGESRSERPNGLGDTAMSLATTLRALPKFIYPTVEGATAAEREMIYATLDKLPLKDVTAASSLHVIPGLDSTGISGMSQPGLGLTRILYDRAHLNNPNFGEELVIHEHGHAVDYTGNYGLLGALNWRGPFGSAPFVSHYAGGNRYEDFAESYHAYHTDRENFVRNFPEKARVIEEAGHLTPSEMLADRPAVRDAGRRMGNAMSSVPYLRTTLELMGAMLSPMQMHKGSKALEAGLINGDRSKQLQGKMNLMSGLLLALPGGAPFALATSVTHQALQRYADQDPEKLAVAHKVANSLMAVSTGPLGMATLAIRQELEKEGIDITQVMSEGGFDKPRGPSGGTILKGLISTVGGAVGGSLLGVTLGTQLAGPAGAAMGAFWGRLGGGMLGLGAYGAWRAKHQEAQDPSPYDLTRSDKIFLGKIVGTSAVGAAAGSIGGFELGGRAGVWLGQAVGGAVGAGVGGWIGAVGGLLAGSYGLGKLGAFVGRKWAGKESEFTGTAPGSPPGSPGAPPPEAAPPSAAGPETKA